MSVIQNISGGRNTINIVLPEQQEINLQNKSEVLPVRVYPKERDAIEKLAAANGASVSVFCRMVILRYIKSEPKLRELHKVLDEIFT